jgi:nitrogen regulatory protein PII
MTNYHLKKRIDVIVEAPLMRMIANRLDRANVSGYSVTPVLEGRGMVNAWSSEGQVGNSANMIALLCVVDAAVVDGTVDSILNAIGDRVGFLTVSDVFVVRPERF